jgi:DNA-binding transcriptional LysR family regulator
MARPSHTIGAGDTDHVSCLSITNRHEYPDYHESLATLFAGLKIKPRISEEHDSAGSLIAAVEAGNGVAVVTESLSCVAGPRLKLVRLSPAPGPFIIVAVWPKVGLTPAAEQFLKCAKAVALTKW